MTALAWAALQDHDQIVDVLLKAGADPDIQDKVAKYGVYAYGLLNYNIIPWPLYFHTMYLC